MIVYLIAAILTFFIASQLENIKFIFSSKSKQIIWIKALIIAIPYFVLSFFRDSTIGTDYLVYTGGYYRTGLGYNREIEVLGNFIIGVARKMNNPLWIIFLYSSLICFCGMYWIIRQSKHIKYSALLFWGIGFFNWSLNIMRQSLATVIVFIGLICIYKDNGNKSNYLKFCFFIIIGSMFHKTALLYLILLIFPYKYFAKNFKKFLFILPLLALISGLLREVIMLISKHFNFYYRYFNNVYDTATYTGSLIMISTIVMFLTLVTYNKWKTLEKKYYVLAAMVYISVAISLVANIIPNNARIIFLFYPISIIAIPEFIALQNGNKKKLLTLLITAFLGIFYINSFVINKWGNTVPYLWNFSLF